MKAMAKKRNFTDEAHALAERVRGALKKEVRRRDIRQIDLEEALERSHGYFSHLFAGRMALTLEGVFEVLLAIHADPADFFTETLKQEEKPKGAPSFDEIERTVLRALKRYGYAPAEEGGDKKGKGRT
jgi:hypothetical protein